MNTDLDATKKVLAIALGVSFGFQAVFLFNFFRYTDGLNLSPFDPIGGDFINYWTASVLVAKGNLLNIFDIERFHAAQTDLLGREFQLRVWSYPPHFLFFIHPLSWFSYLSSYLLWSGITFALCSLALSPKILKHSSGIGILAFVLAPASFINFVAGQNGFLSAACLIGGMLLVSRFPYKSGILFGLLSFKPHLGILIPVVLIASRQWKPFVSGAITIFLLIGMSVVFHGLEAWDLFFSETMKINAQFLQEGTGMLMNMQPSIFMSGRILGFSISANSIIQGIGSLIVIGVIYWIGKRNPPEALLISAVSAGTFLVSPYGHNYDFTILSIAIIFFTSHVLQGGFFPYERMVLVFAWLLPLLMMPLNFLGIPVAPLILGAFLYFIVKRVKRFESDHHVSSHLV